MQRIFLVARENIDPLWPQAEPLIASAIAPIPTHTTDDVRQMLHGNAAQLWAQWGEQLEACVVTEFVHYPRGTWVRIWIAGAHPDAKWDGHGFHKAVDGWRDLHGCRGFEAIGRHGFLRLFPGLRAEGVLMRMTVA